VVTVNLGITGALYDALKIFLQWWSFATLNRVALKQRKIRWGVWYF